MGCASNALRNEIHIELAKKINKLHLWILWNWKSNWK